MTTEKRRKTGRSAKPARTMADYAMSFDRLGLWMSTRAKSATLRHPQATSLSMLDGAVAAVVAGPVSMMPEEWICPLLGVDPDDFNHDTETFSAIAATLMRHNAISNTLPTKPDSFVPLLVRRPDGEVDVGPWCMGFYAVIKLRLLAWSDCLTRTPPNTVCCCRSCAIASIPPVVPCSTPNNAISRRRLSNERLGGTFRTSSRPCVSSGCPRDSNGTRNRRSNQATKGVLVPLTINRPRRHQNLQLVAKAYHDARRSAANTTVSVLTSTPSGTRTRAPAVSISINRPQDPDPGAISPLAVSLSLAIATGIKRGACVAVIS